MDDVAVGVPGAVGELVDDLDLGALGDRAQVGDVLKEARPVADLPVGALAVVVR